jgi:hypothetical protein
MSIIAEDFSKSNIIVPLSQIGPVPTVTLSKDYDFSLSIEPVASNSAELQNLKSPSNEQVKGENGPSILTPEENENFTDNRPLFQGKALPNETVKITIHSDQGEEITVTADQYGNWSYRPDQSLSPGEHTITIATKDSNGISRLLTKTFTVFEFGSQVAESATPSVTLTPTVTPTVTPVPITIPTLSPTPTGSPTSSLTPTSTLTQPPIKTPTPTLSPTGSSAVIGFSILGFAVTLFGGTLFFLARRSINFL